MFDRMSSRRIASKEERRATLLAAARDVFSNQGYHAATIDDVTRAAGVAKGTFYLYFKDKQQVYAELLSDFLRVILETVRGIGPSATSADDFRSRHLAAGLTLARHFDENAKIARVALRESTQSGDPLTSELVSQFYRDIADAAAANVRRGIELDLFRPVEPLVVAYMHIGMVERVVVAMLEDQTRFPAREEVVRQVISVAYDGIRKS
jgi:AcrR family transcriptional regulator